MMAYGDDRSRAGGLFFSGISVNSTPPVTAADAIICQDQKNRPLATKDQGDPLLAIKILSGVARLKGRFGLGMAVKMLTGSREKAIGDSDWTGFPPMDFFLSTLRSRWRNGFRNFQAQGFLRQESATLGEKQYRVLSVTPSGWQAMKRREIILLSHPVDRAGSEKRELQRREITKGGLRSIEEIENGACPISGVTPLLHFSRPNFDGDGDEISRTPPKR